MEYRFTVSDDRELIYLDNSATTKAGPEAVQALCEAAVKDYGNPSSLHRLGLEAQQRMDRARENAARLLHAKPEEITFTSGGTEANNLAIIGAATALKRRGNKIMITNTEHSSALDAAKHLQEQGFAVDYIEVSKTGEIDIEKAVSQIGENTLLISVMAVNNETGAVYPVRELSLAAHRKKPDILFHCDAVQAFGKMPIDVSKWRLDLLSASAHKIHGVKGAGLLYKTRNARILPRTFGGGQEKKLRTGTESVPLIASFGEACRLAYENMEENRAYMQGLYDYAVKTLSEIPDIRLHIMAHPFPYLLNLSTMSIKSETMIHFLAGRNIFVSGGSACAKGAKSETLAAMGYSDREIASALRISFDRQNTMEQIDRLAAALREGMDTLVKMR